jgi:hypothetical protein
MGRSAASRAGFAVIAVATALVFTRYGRLTRAAIYPAGRATPESSSTYPPNKFDDVRWFLQRGKTTTYYNSLVRPLSCARKWSMQVESKSGVAA